MRDPTPWDFPDTSAAPDGSNRLQYVELWEIASDGPLRGRPRLEPDGIDFGERLFGGPPVWSANGRYLAMPEWTEQRDQRLTVFDLRERREATSGGPFRVLALQVVAEGQVRGIDSPAHDPAIIAVPLAGLAWQPLGERKERLSSPEASLPRRLLWAIVATAWNAAFVGLMAVALGLKYLFRLVAWPLEKLGRRQPPRHF